MTQKISNLQLVFFVANFIVSATLISLPQIIVQVMEQNGWLIPIVLFPIILLMTFLVFGKKSRIETLKNLFDMKNRKNVEKLFILFYIPFVLMIFIHDLRALVDFVAAVLLPNTPLDLLMALSVLVVLYIAMAGIEVIARINAIHFCMLAIIIFSLPIMLLTEWQIENLQPVPSLETVISTAKTIMITLSWVGEFLLFLLIIANVNPVKEARKAVITGTALGLGLLAILLFLEITVLGPRIVKDSTYPNYILIQQIHLTDFLDRLDLVIVAVWVPTLIAKLSFLLYVFNYCLSYFYKSDTNKFLLPISVILGFLSIVLFKNSMEHLHFSFYSLGMLALLFELALIVLFFFVKKSTQKQGNERAAEGES